MNAFGPSSGDVNAGSSPTEKDAISKTNARLFSSWIQPLGGVENIHRAGLDRTAAAQNANPAFRQADTAFAPRRYRVQYLARRDRY
jgi:hypothetical protein